MKDDSEEARLIGDRSTTNSMSYTEGPKAPLTSNGIVSPAPPSYENTVKGGGNDCDGDENCRKSSASDESQNSELINDFMNFSGGNLKTQFHADALKQVGFGKCQAMIICIAGFAFAAQIVQMFSLFFILPSIDLEFCMQPDQKNTLIVLSVFGTAFGAMVWGSFADLNGRKRTLLACMFCMTIFSVVSAFMPTFGPFAMAILCASISGGGIFPVSAVVVAEFTSSKQRGRSVAIFVAIGLSGAIFVGSTAFMVLPMTGQELMLEQREHFRAWHLFLLALSVSSIVPIIGLFTLTESPRWLLEVGREVEALEIYQKIYCANRANGRYTLTELELPGIHHERHATPKSVLTGMVNDLHQFFYSFVCLFRPVYLKTTLMMIIIWFGTLFSTYGLTVFSLRLSRSLESEVFNSMTVVTYNNTLENITLSMNFVNQHFEFCRFVNVTFEQIFLSYVKFINCTFLDSNFHGVKTGNTSFVYTFFGNVKFIDTNVDEQNFIGCVKNSTEIDRMVGGCDQQFDFNIFSKVLHHANIGCILPSLLIVIWSGLTLNRFGRTRVASFCISMTAFLCCVVGFICGDSSVYWTIGIIQAVIFAALMALTLFTIEYYRTLLRTTALGLFAGFGLCGALIGGIVYLGLPVGDICVPAVMSIAGLLFPCLLSTFLKETAQNS